MRAAKTRASTQSAIDELTPLWTALADPTRRAILDLLRERPYTTGELSDQFPTTRFAVMKHLNILESAELIVVRRKGRERWNYLNVVPLQLLFDRWVKPYQAIWSSRMSKLKSELERTPSKNADRKP